MGLGAECHFLTPVSGGVGKYTEMKKQIVGSGFLMGFADKKYIVTPALPWKLLYLAFIMEYLNGLHQLLQNCYRESKQVSKIWRIHVEEAKLAKCISLKAEMGTAHWGLHGYLFICVNITLVIIWLTPRSKESTNKTTQYILSPQLYISIGTMPILHILKSKVSRLWILVQAVHLCCHFIPWHRHTQVCDNLMLAAQALWSFASASAPVSEAERFIPWH